MAFTAWVCAFICAALFFPNALTHWGTYQYRRLFTPLIWVIMFGMGTTLTFDDFARIARMPWGVLVGVVCQYTIMPVMGWTFAWAFGLEPEVALGLILIGSCPGGASSNVLNYLAGANVPLSVTMTAVSTLLSPLTTPLAMKLLAGQTVDVPFWPMALEIVNMVVVPVVSGLLINRYLPAVARWLGSWLPAVSMLCICLIIGVTIGMARDRLLSVGLALWGASACHNAAGFLLGYWGARCLGLNRRDCRTVAIEVGIQNGGMATGLAINVFGSPLVAMASAVFGPWSAISGSALASYWHARPADGQASVYVPQSRA
jgi:BASS family bile acid:Na+ symporter